MTSVLSSQRIAALEKFLTTSMVGQEKNVNEAMNLGSEFNGRSHREANFLAWSRAVWSIVVLVLLVSNTDKFDCNGWGFDVLAARLGISCARAHNTHVQRMRCSQLAHALPFPPAAQRFKQAASAP